MLLWNHCLDHIRGKRWQGCGTIFGLRNPLAFLQQSMNRKRKRKTLSIWKQIAFTTNIFSPDYWFVSISNYNDNQIDLKIIIPLLPEQKHLIKAWIFWLKKASKLRKHQNMLKTCRKELILKVPILIFSKTTLSMTIFLKKCWYIVICDIVYRLLKYQTPLHVKFDLSNALIYWRLSWAMIHGV